MFATDVRKENEGISCVYIVFFAGKKKSYPCDECSRVMLVDKVFDLSMCFFLIVRTVYPRSCGAEVV